MSMDALREIIKKHLFIIFSEKFNADNSGGFVERYVGKHPLLRPEFIVVNDQVHGFKKASKKMATLEEFPIYLELEGIQNEKDIIPIRKYKPDAILLDGYSVNKMGGTGTSFDWKIVKKLRTSIPVIVAGGLTHLNVSQAIRIVNPYAVDVSSGVESSPGKKDRKLIKKFIDAAKG